MTWRIVVADAAKKALNAIQDKRELGLVLRRIGKLAEDPDKQGKALRGDLAGFRSVRAAGQRWRIIYELQNLQALVTIIFLGRRKQGDKRDVYELIRKLLRNDLV